MIDETSENRGRVCTAYADMIERVRKRRFIPRGLPRKAAVGGGCRACPAVMIPFILRQKRVFAVILLLALNGAAYAQNYLDPLWNYRNGRELESLNRMREADYFYGEAARICNDQISRNAATRDTYTALAWTLQRQGKYEDVIIWGERGLRLYADEYRLVETMGEAYFYLDDLDQSLRFMQRYANSAPRGERISVAYFFIGEIYRVRKFFRHADIAYSAAVSLEPGTALWWFRLGSVREAAGDFPHAVEAYERAIELNPPYPEAGEGLARSRGRTG